MPSKILWDAAAASEGDVLTTTLDNLADAAWCAVGAEYDNSADLIQYFKARLSVTFGSAPGATGYVSLYAITALDGTNYETLDTDNDPRADKLVAVISVIDSTSAQLRDSGIFVLPPSKVKFVLKNSAGQAFPASGSKVTLYSFSDEGQ